MWEAGSNLWWSPGDIISDCQSPDRSTRLIRGTPAGLITNARRNLPQPPFSRVFAFRSCPVHALSPSPNLTCLGAFSQRVQGRMRRLCGRHKLIAYCREHCARFPAEGAHVAYLAVRCKAPQGRQFRPSAGNAGTGEHVRATLARRRRRPHAGLFAASPKPTHSRILTFTFPRGIPHQPQRPHIRTSARPGK